MNWRHQNVRLRRLEAEAIYIMRGVVSEFRNPVMLDSMGKDLSALLLQVHHDALEVAPGTRRVLAGLCVSFALLKVCPAVQARWPGRYFGCVLGSGNSSKPSMPLTSMASGLLEPPCYPSAVATAIPP